MSTLARARRSVKATQFEARTEPDGSILINGTAYHVEAIPAGEFGTVAFRLSKQAGNGAVYDVIRTHIGTVECDCPDYEARHRGHGFGCCKHGRALVELGLVPAAGPDETHLAEVDPAWSVLPRPSGEGLAPEELGRLHRQRDRVVSAYRAAAPEADQVEVRRVAENAARDALRAILRSRPAPTIGFISMVGVSEIDTPGVTEKVTPGVVERTTLGVVEMTTPDTHCCAADEPTPCVSCEAAGDTMIVSPDPACVTMKVTHAPGDTESDPEDWPSWNDSWYWEPEADDNDTSEPDEPEARLTLAELVGLQARRFRSIGNGFGDLVGNRLERLLREIQATSVYHPGLVDDRLAVLDCVYADPSAAFAGDWRVPGEPELTPAGLWA